MHNIFLFWKITIINVQKHINYGENGVMGELGDIKWIIE